MTGTSPSLAGGLNQWCCRPAISRGCLALSAAVAITGAATSANADEGGVSFWLLGQYGSLAAVPMEPGWSLPVIYYHHVGRSERIEEFRPANEQGKVWGDTQ